MSWNIQARGTRKAVWAYVAKTNQYPQDGDQSHIESAKTLILAEVNAQSEGALVNVEASGHADAQGNRSMTIKVERVFVLPGTVISDETHDEPAAIVFPATTAADREVHFVPNRCQDSPVIIPV